MKYERYGMMIIMREKPEAGETWSTLHTCVECLKKEQIYVPQCHGKSSDFRTFHKDVLFACLTLTLLLAMERVAVTEIARYKMLHPISVFMHCITRL